MAKHKFLNEGMTLDQKLERLRWRKKYENLQRELRKHVFDRDDAYEERIVSILKRISATRLVRCTCCGSLR